MKNLKSVTGNELVDGRFVFFAEVLNTETVITEKLSEDDFTENVLTNEQAKIKAANLIKKVQENPKLKTLKREDFVKLIKEVEASDGNDKNDNQQIGLEELSQFEASLEKLLESGGQSDYGLEAREEGADWEKSLPDSVKKLIEATPNKKFDEIPGEKFLDLTQDERVVTFVEKSGDKYKVNFHGNDSAFRAIGLGDLLPEKHCLYVKRNGVVGKLAESEIYGMAKIGYDDAQGNYLGINDDDEFELTVSEDEIKGYEADFEGTYTRPNAERIKAVQDEFKAKFPEIEENIGSLEKEGSRSFRNNNPGNLKAPYSDLAKVQGIWDGVLGIDLDGFVIFENEESGMNALKQQIKKKSNLTLEKFINEYAPSFENNTNVYLEFLEKKTGKTKDTKLSEIDTNVLAQAIKKHEGWIAPSTANMELAGQKISSDELINAANEYKGSRYVLGGEGKSGIDCSGLVIQALRDKNVISKKSDTTAHGLYNMSSKIDKNAGERGDLLFWGSGKKITHVAIILGKNSDGSYKTLESAKRFNGVSEGKVSPNKGQKYVGKLSKFVS